MSARQPALEATGTAGHSVQLYKADAELLVCNVGEYLSEGLERGDGLLILATPAHRERLLRRIQELGGDAKSAAAAGRLISLDASDVLSRFLGEGKADWDGFEQELQEVAERLGRASCGLRAYSEVVGLLWAAGKYAAAMRLEGLWNGLLGRRSFSLYCGYPIDIFGSEFQLGAMEALLCAHTRLVSGAADSGVDEALRTAMDEVLGRRAEGLRSLMRGVPERACPGGMPGPESDILWLRTNLPDEAERVLARAREYYEESKRLGTRGDSKGARN